MWSFCSAPGCLALIPAVFFHTYSLIMTLNLAPKASLTFFPAWKLFKASEEPLFPLLQYEALKCLTIPVLLGGSLHSSLIWLSSLLNRACIEHSFPTLSERSFTTHFFMLSGASGSSCSYIKKRHCLFLSLKIIVSHGSKPWAQCENV